MASFGTTLNEAQIAKLHLLKEIMGAKEILVWFDRDKPRTTAHAQAIAALEADGLTAKEFDWDQTFRSDAPASVGIPDTSQDPGDFSATQIQWLTREMAK
jgi:DNA primase